MRVQIYRERDNRSNELFLRDGHAFVAQPVEDSPGICGVPIDAHDADARASHRNKCLDSLDIVDQSY